MYFGSALLS